jgi:thiol:disulfide interchange protein DsbA
MKTPTLTALLMLLAFVANDAQAQAPAPVAGKDYVEIPNGRPLEPADGKVVVEEFFNYICPACNGFEPVFQAWQAQLPAYVKLVHIPASFRADFVPYARAYYAAETFGLVDKTHHAVYEAIHRTHKLPAEGDKPDDKKIAAFYSDYGVSADQFLAAMHSFGVDVKMRKATQHMQQCMVSSTPSIVVNGRYLVKGSSYADMLRIASYLIEKEHAE